MKSVPRADRGPRAGSPRGVVEATGCAFVRPSSIPEIETPSLSLRVLTSSPKAVIIPLLYHT